MLHATIEHQLDAPTTAEAESTRSQDEAARAAFIAWQTRAAPLHGVDANPYTEPEPRSSSADDLRSHRTDDGLGHDLRHQVLAICVALALGVGAGWIGHRGWTAQNQQVDSASFTHDLMHDAMVAHAVYAVDARHPVELNMREQDQLLSWLSRRLGRPVTLPDLTHIGWSTLGGRLLPGDSGGASNTRAQIMYEDKGGQRLTLYLSVLQASARASTDADPTQALRATDDDDPLPGAGQRIVLDTASRDSVHSVYWTASHFGFALVGELPRDALERIGNEVYRKTLAVTTTVETR